MKKREDFDIGKFRVFNGSNIYLNKKAFVFNIFLEPEGPEASFYKTRIYNEFPVLKYRNPTTVIDLFSSTLIHVLRMDRKLFITDYSISEEKEDYVVAVEYFDYSITESCIQIMSEWFKCMNDGKKFNFQQKWEKVQSDFSHTIYGDPQIYSFLEAGVKNKIPCFSLETEHLFQWGYGKKQVRGFSFSFNTNSITDQRYLSELTNIHEFSNHYLNIGKTKKTKFKNTYFFILANGMVSLVITKKNTNQKYTTIDSDEMITNFSLIENIFSNFNIAIMEVIVEADSISDEWNKNRFNIIKCNIGNEIPKERAVYYVENADLANRFMVSRFSKPEQARITIIAGNNISQKQANTIWKKLKNIKPSIYFASLINNEISINGNPIQLNENHARNVEYILRNPNLEFAVFNHQTIDVTKYGYFHEGADVFILDSTILQEDVLKSITRPEGILIHITKNEINIFEKNQVCSKISFFTKEDKEKLLLSSLDPILKRLWSKYN